MRIRRLIAGLLLLASIAVEVDAQALPTTAGETLSGKRIVLGDAVKGRSAVFVIGFTKDAGPACGDWAKAIRGDTAFAGVLVFQVAMLEQAPGFVRGMIKSGMRKGRTAAELDSFVVLTQDEKLWRSYLVVTAEKEPYVLLLDASGAMKWHGHGAAKDLEPLVRAAKTGSRE